MGRSRGLSYGEMVFTGVIIFILLIGMLLLSGVLTLGMLNSVWLSYQPLGTILIFFMIALLFIFGSIGLIRVLIKK